MGRYKSLGSLKSFLWCAPQLPGASMWYFHILSCLRAHRGEWLQSEGWLDSRYFFFFPELAGNITFPGLLRFCSGKESACQCRGCKKSRFDPWVTKIPCSIKWQPLQCSCPENSVERGVWWPTVPGVMKSGTWLSLHTCTHIRTHCVSQEQALYFIPTESPYRTKFWLHTAKVRWILCVCVLGTQSCPTLCSPPGSSIHGILQARILEWVAISSSMGESYLHL